MLTRARGDGLDFKGTPASSRSEEERDLGESVSMDFLHFAPLSFSCSGDPSLPSSVTS